MTNITALPLNAGQTAAAEYFFTFLFNDEKEMGISGPGGVGKSHLMSAMINDVMPRYHETCQLMNILPEYDDVRMTALTNKAADVLGVFTQRPVETIYSLMNLKVEDDYKTGQSRVTPTRAWKVHEKKIIFIDECSMTDSVLDRYIGEGTQNCKIVWVGDDKQLAPIMEPISPIYRRGIKFFELTEPMRNTHPAVLALHEQLRETVETGVFKPIQIVPGVIDYLDSDQMQEKLKETFAQQTLESRILCYTNQRVIAYNDYIRDLRNLPPQYTVGEFLINNMAIRLSGNMISVEEELEIVALGKIFDIPIEDTTLQVQEATLQSRYGDVYRDVPIPLDRNHFANLMKHFAKNKNWHSYFDLKNNYPDLRQRDASTAYKAQGSTYATNFVDLSDISDCRNPNQAARMLYVALSRFKERLFLYGKLADKFGGLKF